VGAEERMAFILDSEGSAVALVEHRRGADA